MSLFELSRKAKEDLRRIAKYTEKRWGQKHRNLYIRQFDDGFHLLAKPPLVGKQCDHIKVCYRKFPQGSYIIFYHEAAKSKIIIIRILHKYRDIESKFVYP